MSSKAARASLVGALFVVVVCLVVFASMAWLRTDPPTINYTAGLQPGQPVNLTVQTVGSLGPNYVNPDWVSYLAETPQGQWVHSTLWQLPAHTKINMTIYQFDSGSPLRNPQIDGVQGTDGGVEYLNGKPMALIDSAQGNGVGHTFTVPELDINVPLPGVNGNANNFCSAAPCPLSDAHNTVKFSFTTPGPGNYRFQCFIPCGLSYLYGNGGPMSTIGYMGGFLEVQ